MGGWRLLDRDRHPFRKGSNLKTLAILLIVVVILSITALVVSRTRKSPMIVPASAHPGDLILEPCDYKTKYMTYKAECGSLIVPENRFDPTSRLIALPVKRIHAESNS